MATSKIFLQMVNVCQFSHFYSDLDLDFVYLLKMELDSQNVTHITQQDIPALIGKIW